MPNHHYGHEIDRLVYDLYSLTLEEFELTEGNATK
jgi:hypothetical protein